MYDDTVSLSKGQSVALGKDNYLNAVTVGLGWKSKGFVSGEEFDLDASVFCLNAREKCPEREWFVFYGNLSSPGGCVQHMGDDLVGGDGNNDDEQIVVKLREVPDEIVKIAVVVTMYEARARNQNFGQVRAAYVRVVNNDNGRELVRFDLPEDYSTEDGVAVGELIRNTNGSWSFHAVGAGSSAGLAGFCHHYGLMTS